MRLITCSIDGQPYFVDLRLRQVRNVDNPHDFLSFEEVHDAMLSVTGVEEVKDLHLWSLSSGFDALSAHVVVPDVARSDEVRLNLRGLLRERFHIEHTTLEVQRPGDTPGLPPGMEGSCGALHTGQRRGGLRGHSH